MAILIADSGSTKTDWRLISSTGIVSVQTEGMNPYFISKDEIKELLRKKVVKKIEAEKVETVYFYGAGCAAEEKKIFVKKCLKKVFSDAKVLVETDLLGAARGLLDKNEGLIFILGTGMNSGYYDGKEIIQNVPSLGYVLGDEGSGTYIGKLLLADYLRGNWNEHLKNSFEKFSSLTYDEIIDHVYRKKFPNRFIASFTRFASEHLDEDSIRAIIRFAFSSMFDLAFAYQWKNGKHIRTLSEFSATGSVAFAFKNILNDVGTEFGFTKSKIEAAPIDGLMKFHSL